MMGVGGAVDIEKVRRSNLLVLWTNDNRETALNMILMYTYNAKFKGWWSNVALLVWGASGRLLAKDVQIQTMVHKMKEAGIRIFICKRCLENLGIVEEVEKLGHEVFYVGEEFTRLLKEGWTVLSL
jgi:hypothetical protein